MMSTMISNPCFDDIYKNISLRKNSTPLQGTDVQLRLMILEEEQFQFSHSSQWKIRVLMGVAWLSSEGRDFVLTPNDSQTIPKQKHNAILSTVNNAPVLLEISRI